ncbi:GPW/gp25 family protein [Algibacter miyuki]|uniref:GPW/gp25 family protein n=1 Tax=Algibacter miyuki TaxID=1306933 RepID=A0ABV5H4R7_9FLAO|nr:GPW/gp25 family protein [Algibacter miyuki]MDN3663820.1 GPW/gp25 family protein [Algibacter miyuki]
MEDINKSFLGRGWAFPPAFIKENNSLEMTENEKDITQAIRIIIGTIPGERLMVPEFGCSIHKYLFETRDPTHMTMLRDAVYDALLYHEPRIKNIEINIKEGDADGVINLHIDYTIIITNSRSNMVLPYYLNEGTNI